MRFQKYNEFKINELNKNTYIDAANKMTNDIDALYDDNEAEYDYLVNRADEIRKHATYIDVITNSKDAEKVEIFKSLKYLDGEHNKYSKLYDKFHKIKPSPKNRELRKQSYDDIEKFRKVLFKYSDDLMDRIIKYYGIEINDVFEYKNRKGIITTITPHEIRFNNDISNIDIKDIPYLMEEKILVKSDIKAKPNQYGAYEIPSDKPKIKIDKEILDIRKDIKDYVSKNSYFTYDEDSDEVDVNKEYDNVKEIESIYELQFSTRQNGSISSEKHSDIDYNAGVKLKNELVSKFNVKANIEIVDEWIMLFVTILK